MCTVFLTTLILYNQKYIIVYDRVSQILGLVLVLCLYQFNIILLNDYYELNDMVSNIQMLFSSLDIAVFLMLTYMFLNSYDLSDKQVLG